MVALDKRQEDMSLEDMSLEDMSLEDMSLEDKRLEDKRQEDKRQEDRPSLGSNSTVEPYLGAYRSDSLPAPLELPALSYSN